MSQNGRDLRAYVKGDEPPGCAAANGVIEAQCETATWAGTFGTKTAPGRAKKCVGLGARVCAKGLVLILGVGEAPMSQNG